MNKSARISIILLLILIFPSVAEAWEPPLIRYEIEVRVYKSCPPKEPELMDAYVTVSVKSTVVPTHPDSNLMLPEWGAKGSAGLTPDVGRFVYKGAGYVYRPGKIWENIPDAVVAKLPEALKDPGNWEITATLDSCPEGYAPAPASRTVTANRVTGSPEEGFTVYGHVVLFCRCVPPEEKKVGALISPGPAGQAYCMATVAVMEEEKVQVAQEIGGQVVAAVVVNDEPRKPPKPEEGIPVNPGDVVQLISTVGIILGQFTFVPEVEKTPSGPPPVVECPLGKPAVVSVPGNYTSTSIENMAVTTAPVGTALATGPEKAPAVTTTKGGPTQVPGLEPVLKTGDTVVAAGQLDNSAMGSNAISVTDKNTGKVLGQTQVDMWRLAGASLNPPMVNKGRETNLSLNIFGPPDLTMEVTATAGEGLTPKQLTATAPIGVLQSQGLGAFTATKSGTHNVSVKASPVINK